MVAYAPETKRDDPRNCFPWALISSPVRTKGTAGALPRQAGPGPLSPTPSGAGKHLSEVLHAEVPLRRGKALQLPRALGTLPVRAPLHQDLFHDALPLRTPDPHSGLLKPERILGVPKGHVLLPRQLGFQDWVLKVRQRLNVHRCLLQIGRLGPGAEVLLLAWPSFLSLGGQDHVLVPQSVKVLHHLVLVMQLLAGAREDT